MGKKKDNIQFRYYQLPEDSFVFAKLGPSWIREYGKGIDYLHFHNVLEIGCCRAGTGNMIFRDQVCPYKPGDISIIPKKYPHTTNSVPGTLSHWEYLFINEEPFLEKIFAGQSHRTHRQRIIEALNREVLFFPQQKYPGLSKDILDLMECMRKKDSFFQEESEGILASLLVKAARILEEAVPEEPAEESPSGPIPLVISNAMDYISEHFGEDLTVENLAKVCSVSENHLRRLFASYMKMGVLEYIHFVRVCKACQMLRETDDSIADISYRCGFSTISTFNRNFKRITGQNPGNWRSRPENFQRDILNYPIHSERGW